MSKTAQLITDERDYGWVYAAGVARGARDADAVQVGHYVEGMESDQAHALCPHGPKSEDTVRLHYRCGYRIGFLARIVERGL